MPWPTTRTLPFPTIQTTPNPPPLDTQLLQNEYEGNDILEDCFLMPIPDEEPVWVRAEYKRIYDAVLTIYNKVSAPLSRARHSVVVTGQPGIGQYSGGYLVICSCVVSTGKSTGRWRRLLGAELGG